MRLRGASVRKKYLWWFIAILTVSALVAMPAFAGRNNDDDGHRGRYTQHNRHSHQKADRDDDGDPSFRFDGDRYEYRVVVRLEAKLAALEFIEEYLDSVVKKAIKAIQKADSYEEMVKIAERVDRIVRRTLEKLEGIVGRGKVKAFEITVCNEKVGRCVTFDPIHLCGFR